MKNDDWEISVGVYSGLLLGFRTYEEQFKTNHVLYIPFVDVCLTIWKK